MLGPPIQQNVTAWSVVADAVFGKSGVLVRWARDEDYRVCPPPETACIAGRESRVMAVVGLAQDVRARADSSGKPPLIVQSTTLNQSGRAASPAETKALRLITIPPHNTSIAMPMGNMPRSHGNTPLQIPAINSLNFSVGFFTRETLEKTVLAKYAGDHAILIQRNNNSATIYHANTGVKEIDVWIFSHALQTKIYRYEYTIRTTLVSVVFAHLNVATYEEKVNKIVNRQLVHNVMCLDRPGKTFDALQNVLRDAVPDYADPGVTMYDDIMNFVAVMYAKSICVITKVNEESYHLSVHCPVTRDHEKSNMLGIYHDLESGTYRHCALASYTPRELCELFMTEGRPRATTVPKAAPTAVASEVKVVKLEFARIRTPFSVTPDGWYVNIVQAILEAAYKTDRKVARENEANYDMVNASNSDVADFFALKFDMVICVIHDTPQACVFSATIHIPPHDADVLPILCVFCTHVPGEQDIFKPSVVRDWSVEQLTRYFRSLQIG